MRNPLETATSNDDTVIEETFLEKEIKISLKDLDDETFHFTFSNQATIQDVLNAYYNLSNKKPKLFSVYFRGHVVGSLTDTLANIGIKEHSMLKLGPFSKRV